MDVATIDNSYAQVEAQSQQTVQLIAKLAQKLQTASDGGDPNAREWNLDLKEIALGLQAEQNQIQLLLQALHDFVNAQLQYQPSPTQAPAPQQYAQQAPYAQQGQYGSQPQQGGGILQNFLGGGFGSAIATGAGFGIGDSIISDIFR